MNGARSRAEHLAWAKARALAELDRPGEGMAPFGAALASMAGDLETHEGTKGHIGIKLGIMLLLGGELRHPREWREFIEGFR
jgi:hypothetical protein